MTREHQQSPPPMSSASSVSTSDSNSGSKRSHPSTSMHNSIKVGTPSTVASTSNSHSNSHISPKRVSDPPPKHPTRRLSTIYGESQALGDMMAILDLQDDDDDDDDASAKHSAPEDTALLSPRSQASNRTSRSDPLYEPLNVNNNSRHKNNNSNAGLHHSMPSFDRRWEQDSPNTMDKRPTAPKHQDHGRPQLPQRRGRRSPPPPPLSLTSQDDRNQQAVPAAAHHNDDGISTIKFEDNTDDDDEYTLAHDSHDQHTVTSNKSSRSGSVAPPSVDLLTESRIRAFMVDMYEDYKELNARVQNNVQLCPTCTKFLSHEQKAECWNVFFSKYYKPGFVWIRSTGNAIAQPGLVQMFAYDITDVHFSLVSIDSIQIMAAGAVAIVDYTTDQVFNYKGQNNADRTVISCAMEIVDGQCQIVHEHRSAGRPIPRESRWDTTES